MNQKLSVEVKALRARLSSKDEEARKLKANAATLATRLAAIEKKLGL